MKAERLRADELTAEMCKPAAGLLKKLAGWPVDVQRNSYPAEFGGLSVEPNGDGKRSRISVIETVDGVLVRAMHVDTRALIAFWIRRPSASWKFEYALRGRDLANDHDCPRRINTRQLAAYIAAPDLHSALLAVEELAPKVKGEAVAA